MKPITFRATSVDHVVSQIEKSFADADRLQVTYLLLHETIRMKLTG